MMITAYAVLPLLVLYFHFRATTMWKVQVLGSPKQRWEISVVRKDNAHGQRSWGWFDQNKILVSHNGGPCGWPICKFVWEQQLAVAEELCRRLNNGEKCEF